MAALRTTNTPGYGLTRMRRRCKAGACIAAVAWAAVFVTDLIRPTALRTPVELGIELGFLAAVITFGTVACIATALAEYARRTEDRHGDDLAWTLDLGAQVADRYPRPGGNGAATEARIR